MKYRIIFLLAFVIFAFSAQSLLAGDHSGHAEGHEIVIALKTDDFELDETDISDLAIGDAKTIHTESGRTIDLLRTEEGVEIYVDGELLETGMHGEEGLHEEHHVVHKRFEVVCDDHENCEDLDIESLHGEGQHEKIIIISKETESD